MLVLSYKCMRASNNDATRVAKTIQNLKVFRYVTYFAIAIIIFLYNPNIVTGRDNDPVFYHRFNCRSRLKKENRYW